MRFTTILRRVLFTGLLVMASVAVPEFAHAQSQELGLTLGVILSQNLTATDGTKLSFETGTALEANYAHRIFGGNRVELLGGVHFLANGSRSIHSLNVAVPHSVATLYVTPDLILKFAARAKFWPWATVGGGYAQYESSQELQDGGSNPDNIRIHRGALVYGGGLDVPVRGWLALRGEVRDFYSGSPRLNVPLPGGQHNVVAGGGFVLRF